LAATAEFSRQSAQQVAGFSFRLAQFAQNGFVSGDYQLVQLVNGAKTLFSASYGEKMHPGLGPQGEAELLYVRQLKIRERMRNHSGEFVLWDVGLGAAANAIAALGATRDVPGQLRIVSFDNTAEPLEFALQNAAALGYLTGYENQIAALLEVETARCAVRTPQRGVPTKSQCVEFQNGELTVAWEFQLGDFPALIQKAESRKQRAEIPAPHAIFYDAFSPAKNPAMWTLPFFANLFQMLDPQRPCALTTYSRSTMIRTTLLLAGFFVGVGHATGLKEETTIAANTLDLIAEPLNARWLERARRSHSAEPLREPVYSRTPLSAPTLEQLHHHPQFQL
jgi:tRNA U34 5-methylaminomethyl-2-thiouridine-forming methyltransferase MnmC